eukprot:8728541-Pyramimonas_sp.AAC.1
MPSRETAEEGAGSFSTRTNLPSTRTPLLSTRRSDAVEGDCGGGGGQLLGDGGEELVDVVRRLRACLDEHRHLVRLRKPLRLLKGNLKRRGDRLIGYRGNTPMLP